MKGRQDASCAEGTAVDTWCVAGAGVRVVAHQGYVGGVPLLSTPTTSVAFFYRKAKIGPNFGTCTSPTLVGRRPACPGGSHCSVHGAAVVTGFEMHSWCVPGSPFYIEVHECQQPHAKQPIHPQRRPCEDPHAPQAAIWYSAETKKDRLTILP